MRALADFSDLTLEAMMSAVEDSTGVRLGGLAAPLPSYINRVYEFAATGGERLIAKFYRPGRWSEEALRDEHNFVLECAEADIPAVAPIKLNSGDTLGKIPEAYFAIYPKRAGREFEIREESDWRRIGSVIARLHTIGSRSSAPNRITLTPEITVKDIEELLSGDLIPRELQEQFADVCWEIITRIEDDFTDIDNIRIHGDCHIGNILHRPDEGIMLIDLDDMMNGPAMQDLWLVLPERPEKCPAEVEWMLAGYRQFRDFDPESWKLVEPLRAMRIIYFLAWCARQVNDLQFGRHFPDWGTSNFWRREIADLEKQLSVIDSERKTIDFNSEYANIHATRILTEH